MSANESRKYATTAASVLFTAAACYSAAGGYGIGLTGLFASTALVTGAVALSDYRQSRRTEQPLIHDKMTPNNEN